MGWVLPTLWKATCFAPGPPIWMLISSQKILTETSEIMFDHPSGHHVQPSWLLKLAIILTWPPLGYFYFPCLPTSPSYTIPTPSAFVRPSWPFIPSKPSLGAGKVMFCLKGLRVLHSLWDQVCSWCLGISQSDSCLPIWAHLSNQSTPLCPMEWLHFSVMPSTQNRYVIPVLELSRPSWPSPWGLACAVILHGPAALSPLLGIFPISQAELIAPLLRSHHNLDAPQTVSCCNWCHFACLSPSPHPQPVKPWEAEPVFPPCLQGPAHERPSSEG